MNSFWSTRIAVRTTVRRRNVFSRSAGRKPPANVSAENALSAPLFSLAVRLFCSVFRLFFFFSIPAGLIFSARTVITWWTSFSLRVTFFARRQSSFSQFRFPGSHPLLPLTTPFNGAPPSTPTPTAREEKNVCRADTASIPGARSSSKIINCPAGVAGSRRRGANYRAPYG